MRRDDIQDWNERRDVLLEAIAASLSEDERRQFAAELSFVETQIRRVIRATQPTSNVEG